MFQHLITGNISSSVPTFSIGMLILTVIVITLFLLLSLFWIDFFYILFYKTMGLDENSLFDTGAIALGFTLFILFIILNADECVDWNDWHEKEEARETEAMNNLHKHLDELILLIKNSPAVVGV